MLAALPCGADKYEISLGLSTEALKVGGLVSPVFAAFGTRADITGATGLLLCFAASPHSVLKFIQNELPRDLQEQTMVGYGLASVLLAGDAIELREHAAALQPILNAWELWQLEEGVLTTSTIERYVRSGEKPWMPQISADSLPYDAACQVRQLNASLALAAQRAAIYTPELAAAFRALADSAATLVDKLRDIAAAEPTVTTVRRHHYYVSRVLEVNAGLAMVISQTLSGTVPLLNSDYPVGEYGLLGIGSAARALWSFYNHLRRCFAAADHVNRLAESGPGLAPFDPFVTFADLDYTLWDDSPARLSRLPHVEPHPAAPHLVHYSSRFGFHETEYTLGASWQSLHACSSQEWHLLTLTHEFLHSQVRHLTAVIFPADTDWERLGILVAGAEPPTSGLESMRVVLAQGMLRYAAARLASPGITTEADHIIVDGYNARPTGEQLRATAAEELRYLQEIVVHVLDFLYTFPSEPSKYLAAIWQSWSTVPSVTERIHDYLLRSLCALAADAAMPRRDDREVFRTVYDASLEILRDLVNDFDSPVVGQAVAYLENDIGVRRLQLEFAQAYYVARFTRIFLYDPDVATALRTDDQTTLGGSHGRLYVFDPGEYPEDAIESPLAFLSDRFGVETHPASPDSEFPSLWQLLLLIDPETEW